MVLSPDECIRKKDLGYEIIYEDFAKNLGILDKLDNNPWFIKNRISLIDGSKIAYYKVNYINGKYPWEEKIDFKDLIKKYIKESNNRLFIYNPNDFQNAVNQIKKFVQDCNAEGIDNEFIEDGIYVINAFEDSEGRGYREISDYDAHDISKYHAHKDILNLLKITNTEKKENSYETNIFK